ncbi:helix-turn-helix transcriptional regulator [Streptomyces lydicus]|uniref:helix-turn-helix transcriptional regulator n=1 Tax=Streptomyces lydicus TaxID=47763 RepID=UPI0037950AC1
MRSCPASSCPVRTPPGSRGTPCPLRPVAARSPLPHRRRPGRDGGSAPDIPRRTRALRTELGLSQERLAEQAGVSRFSIYRAENATHATSIDHLLQIADALGVPLAALVSDSQP